MRNAGYGVKNICLRPSGKVVDAFDQTSEGSLPFSDVRAANSRRFEFEASVRCDNSVKVASCE